MGMHFAGTVDTIGKDVTEFVPGDEVFGACTGALAEYASRRVREDVRVAGRHGANDALGDLRFRLLKPRVDRYDNPVELIQDRQRIEQMAANSSHLASKDAAGRVATTMEKYTTHEARV